MTRFAVEEALADDFDFPRVVRLLQDLVRVANLELRSPEEANVSSNSCLITFDI